MSQHRGVDHVGLCKPPQRFAKVTRLARIDHRHRQPHRCQSGSHGQLQSSRSFQHEQGRLGGLDFRLQQDDTSIRYCWSATAHCIAVLQYPGVL